MTTGIIGIGHEGHGSRIVRFCLEISPVIFDVVAPFMPPDSRLAVPGFDRNYCDPVGVRTGKDFSCRHLVRPYIDD